MKLRDYKKSKKDFKTVLKLNSFNALAFIYLGVIYEYSEDYNNALKYYMKSYELTQKQELLIYQYIVKRKQN